MRRALLAIALAGAAAVHAAAYDLSAGLDFSAGLALARSPANAYYECLLARVPGTQTVRASRSAANLCKADNPDTSGPQPAYVPGWLGPDSYDTCILKYDTTPYNKLASGLIASACRRLFVDK